MKGLDNLYGNKSQTCHPKGKTYRYAQLGELVPSITVKHTLKHGIIRGSEPTGKKHEESETVAEQQSPQASGCEATMSLWGWRLGVAKTRTRRSIFACFVSSRKSGDKTIKLEHLQSHKSTTG
jgi:hypothetical protein